MNDEIEISRRAAIGGTAALVVAAGAPAAAAAPAAVPYAKFVGEGRRSIKVTRVVAGGDGHAAIEEGHSQDGAVEIAQVGDGVAVPAGAGEA